MEFFGISLHGPQNYLRDILKDNYKEPMSKEDVPIMMKQVKLNSTLPDKIQRPNTDTIKVIDCYIGRANGFAYGSFQRFVKMKRKGIIKPVGPADMFRLPATSSIEYGWWLHDPELQDSAWHITHPRRPQASSPNTLILDVVGKNKNMLHSSKNQLNFSK